jgi:hypothetical protein
MAVTLRDQKSRKPSMSLLGTGALAMWWDVAPHLRAEFEHWHSHEHFPERMSVPGFRRGSRWTDAIGRGEFFVLYELESYEVLTSAPYLERLNSPTPWSLKMMPHHRRMVRSQCRVLETFGGGVARAMATVRISPEAGQAELLHSRLRDILPTLPSRAGLSGAHLLLTQTPDIAATREQRIRGLDGAADWIVLVSGYDASALLDLTEHELGAAALLTVGTQAEVIVGLYDLSHTLSAEDPG